MSNIFLIGYRCTGKSCVGKTLASAIGWTFVDADTELVRENKMTINDMVERHGWSFFRDQERRIIKKLCTLDRRVVATGGGAVLDPKNIAGMRRNGVVVWLKASPETVKRRILQDKQSKALRPALSAKGLIEEIEEILSLRTPLYESAMDFFIETDDRDIDGVCRLVREKIKETVII
jgi:shikimate kinase